MATVVIGAIVFAGIGFAAYHTFKPRKKGGCGCGCEGCAQKNVKNCH
jgi:hypothetical protein